MAEVEVGPNTLNPVLEVDVLDYVRVAFDVIGGEMVVAGPLPDGQNSVAHSDVVVRLVVGQPRYEVPGLAFASGHDRRVGDQESGPEPVAVLL